MLLSLGHVGTDVIHCSNDTQTQLCFETSQRVLYNYVHPLLPDLQVAHFHGRFRNKFTKRSHVWLFWDLKPT